jgi:prephenate dehydratase/chorismate mutase
MELHEVREKIDLIDFRIIKLIEERMELALRAQKLKKGIYDERREQEVLANAERHSGWLLDSEFSRKLFSEIARESRTLQERGLTLIGFQGEHGAYGEVAARRWGKSLIPIPCLEFGDVVSGVEEQKFDLGIVPVENSLEGVITQVNDLLLETPLHIVGEEIVPINHCLMALPGTDYREIKVVYSHPQALAQCRGFLSRNSLEPRPFYDTAGSAKMLSREMPKASAVIASRLCADLYNLDIIKENIEDHESNVTRFVVLSREKASESGDKCSIVFYAPHRAGSLYGILRLFADREINLTRIESRPMRKDPGRYSFFLDFLGREDDPDIQEVLSKVEGMTTEFHCLGFYKKAEQPKVSRE